MKCFGLRFFGFLILCTKIIYSGNISLKNADSLVTWYDSDSVYVTKFLGNVKVLHDDVDINSDEMNYVKKREYLILKHDVKILKKSGEYFFSDSARYFKTDKIISAKGNILAGFTQDSLKIYGDSLIYYLNESKKYGWVWHRPIAMQIKKMDTLKLIGDSIYINRNDSLLKLLSNVLIGSHKNKIISDSAIYYYNKDSVNILGERPTIFTTKDTLVGDVIYGKFRDNSSILKKVDIIGNVKISSSGSSKNENNFVYGESIKALFYNNNKQNLDKVFVIGNPRGLVINKEKRDTVEYSADSMAINFGDSSKIKEIYLIGNSKYTMKKYKVKDDDKLAGDRLIIYFKDSQPLNAKVVNHAKLENFSETIDKKTINQVSGDTINVNFIDGQVDNLDFKGRIEGKVISIPK